jgi:hypothetical protein
MTTAMPAMSRVDDVETVRRAATGVRVREEAC